MRKKFQRMPSYAAKWSPRFGWLSLILLIIGSVSHRFGLLATPHFLILVACIAIFGIIALTLAIKGFSDLWQRGDKGGLKSIKGTILAFLTLLPIFAASCAYCILPPLYDVSTDSETPPQLIANNRPDDALPLHQSLYYQTNEQLTAWPQLTGRRYDGTPDKILPAILAVMDDLNWQIVKQSGTIGQDKALYIEAVAKTTILGFVSDISIRINDEDDTSFVDMRAASRYLPHDLGIDARFILAFMDRLDSKVLLAPNDQSEE